MAASNNETEDRRLGDIFNEAYNLYYDFEKSQLATNSAEFQLEIKKCMGMFEDATRLVSLIGLYSSNETLEEIGTGNLKYLLLPFFLGQLSMKLCSGDRIEIVEVAQVYFKDFLKRCEEYGLYQPNGTVALVEPLHAGGEVSEMAELTKAAQQRNNKMEQYRRKKELDDDIKKIKILMDREHTDDSVQRDFYVKLLRASIIEAQDELSSCHQESQILEHMTRMRLENPNFDVQVAAVRRRPGPPLKPIIITKDATQKAVYGAGYPSLPTMSVDEFYENRVAEGIFPDPTARRDPNSVQSRAMRGDTADLENQEDIQKEQDEENDDEAYLARARGMDEFKDEVRRGDGNRHNRS